MRVFYIQEIMHEKLICIFTVQGHSKAIRSGPAAFISPKFLKKKQELEIIRIQFH